MYNAEALNKILFLQTAHAQSVEITVSGVSMNPTLREGDKILVKRAENYEAGDILVFLYKNNELLVHRILKVKGDKYYCKGDNAFRLEDITLNQIAGKVTHRDGKELLPCPPQLVPLSYLVSRIFRKSGYNIELTKQSGIYRFYRKYTIKEEDITMLYKKNENMDYIPSDETTLAVFDPESGDTHLLDETGTDIINFLEAPSTLEALLDKLCEIYSASPDEIKSDVEEFLAEMVAKKVVVVL